MGKYPAGIVRTLCSRTDLAAAVRHLWVTKNHEVEDDWQVDETLKALKHKLFGGGVSPVGDTMHSVMFASMILSLVPNIESLYIDLFCHLPLVVEKASLARLTELTVRHVDLYFGFCVSTLQPIFDAAPALQVFRGHGVASATVGKNRGVFHARLTTVEACFATLSRGCFKDIMNGFPSLMHFSYLSGGEYVGDVEASPRAILRTLKIRKDSLKHVSIDLSCSDYDAELDQDYDNNDSAMPSLAEMTCLEKLYITGSAIDSPLGETEEAFCPANLLQDFLPPSIRTLRIERPAQDMTGPFLRLAEVASTQFPSLKQLYLSGVQEGMLPKLESVFARNGIVCRERRFLSPESELMWRTQDTTEESFTESDADRDGDDYIDDGEHL